MTRTISVPLAFVAWAAIATSAGTALNGATAQVLEGRFSVQEDLTLGTSGAPVQEQLIQPFQWREIGPAATGGRIADIEAVASDPHVIWVGAATGGVWKSVNNGTTWIPVFDNEPCHSIGNLAIAPSDSAVVWVGTGEANNRNSTSYGCGVFKTIDGGETWDLMGLESSGQIGRILVHPHDPNIVYVAATGPLFRGGGDRGVFKSTDGGRTWTNTLWINEHTGATDLVMHPEDPRVLVAASYQRLRTSWGFNGGGPGSGIWKSTDGGESWIRITQGLPETNSMGRIGLAWAQSDPNILFSLVEPGPTPRAMGIGGPLEQVLGEVPPDPDHQGVYRSEDGGESWSIVSNANERPMYFSKIRVDPSNADIVYSMGRSLFKSIDGGRSFRPLRGMDIERQEMDPAQRQPTHVDHHGMWINPQNGSHILLGHDAGVNISYDGGETWDFRDNLPHGQFYRIGVDMRQPYYVCGGLQDTGFWCGPSQVRAGEATNNRRLREIESRGGGAILNSHWYWVARGDGMSANIDPHLWFILYAAHAEGRDYQINLKTGENVPVRPKNDASRMYRDALTGVDYGPNVIAGAPSDEVFRFNWWVPVEMSPHNSHMLFFGGNRLFVSEDRGQTWVATQDLTKQIDRDTLEIMGVTGSEPMASKNDGVAHYGSLVSIAESPLVPGLIWVGTDDGNVQVTHDYGATWTDVTRALDEVAGFQEPHYVMSIAASHHESGVAYVAVDAHRRGDYTPYLFKTSDYGATWESIANDLPPHGHVNVVGADPQNPDLLYVGTETGLYISLTDGKNWLRFMNGLPAVPVNDIVVHPRENDLVVGTHGRSIFIIDDITPLQQVREDVLEKDIHLFGARPGILWTEDRTTNHFGGFANYGAKNPPQGTAISYYLRSTPPVAQRSDADLPVDATIQIRNRAGEVVRELHGPAQQGLNRVQWDLRWTPPPDDRGRRFLYQVPPVGERVSPGVYTVEVAVGDRTAIGHLTVEGDPTHD